MLRHTGLKRGFAHNLRLAILLCFAAGFINAAGFLAFGVLTTNVTGHAALLPVRTATGQWAAAGTVALWLFLFLLGAFTSGICIAVAGRERKGAFTAPMLINAATILAVALWGHDYDGSRGLNELFAGSLLFAMGMQNALVTVVSGSVVRTTHLTGMFTDLGIDLSELALTPRAAERKLRLRIMLRLAIILCFILGGFIGALLFLRCGYPAFGVPAGVLLLALFYDVFRLRISRKLRGLAHLHDG